MVGFQVRQRERAVSQQTVEKFSSLPVANISDMMSRLQAASAGLRPMHQGGVMAGPALTVRCRPGDNLMVHKALQMAQEGDVIVVDAGGDLTNAIIGELMVAKAIYRKLGGIVINGAVRDSETIASGQFPVFALGVTHRGPYKDGPGEINVPICLGSMVIEPGDLIVGDADGVVSVPFDLTEEVYQTTVKKHAQEEESLAMIQSGTDDTSWVDERLKSLGCKFV
ncbi:RraA family protein [Orrella sp. 11846]|uniref:RraA family protein n=1 Tax=Orrella sp. 11846 TaxID=3409913 RepID=UPI003B5CF3BF